MEYLKYLYLLVLAGIIYALIKLILSLKNLFKETKYLNAKFDKISSNLESAKVKTTTIKENFKGFFPLAGATLAVAFIGSSLRKNSKTRSELIKTAARQYAYNAIRNNKLL